MVDASPAAGLEPCLPEILSGVRSNLRLKNTLNSRCQSRPSVLLLLLLWPASVVVATTSTTTTSIIRPTGGPFTRTPSPTACQTITLYFTYFALESTSMAGHGALVLSCRVVKNQNWSATTTTTVIAKFPRVLALRLNNKALRRAAARSVFYACEPTAIKSINLLMIRVRQSSLNSSWGSPARGANWEGGDDWGTARRSDSYALFSFYQFADRLWSWAVLCGL